MRRRMGLAAAVAVALVVLVGPSASAQTGGDLDCGDPGTSHNMPTPPGDPDGLDADADGVACEDPAAFGASGGAPAPAGDDSSAEAESLPVTGTSTAPLVAGAAVLLAGGAGLVIYGRRRRPRHIAA